MSRYITDNGGSLSMSEYGVPHNKFKGRCSPATGTNVYITLYHDPAVDCYNVVLESGDKVEALIGFTYQQAMEKFTSLVKWWR